MEGREAENCMKEAFSRHEPAKQLFEIQKGFPSLKVLLCRNLRDAVDLVEKPSETQ